MLLGLVIAAYWGRVFRMALKARRRTGRAAGLVPAERIGRILRLIWTPIVLIWIVQPCLVAIAQWHLVHSRQWQAAPGLASRRWSALLAPMYYRTWIAWPALAIVLVCFVLTLICWKTMGRHWRMGIDPSEENPLIATGPFAYVRHPIYALSQLMMLATMAMIPTPLMLPAGELHILLLQWEAWREERHMLRVHGAEYRAYRERVGKFVPRFFSGRPAPGGPSRG